MRHLILIASAAAMAATMPSIADAQGKGKGGDAKAHHSKSMKGHAAGKGNAKVMTRPNTRHSVVADCPPGLAAKSPACMPPGQARQIYRMGQRLPSGYRYIPVPDQYLDRINGYDPDRYRYYYDQDRVYVVDPRTSLISRVIDLVL